MCNLFYCIYFHGIIRLVHLNIEKTPSYNVIRNKNQQNARFLH